MKDATLGEVVSLTLELMSHRMLIAVSESEAWRQANADRLRAIDALPLAEREAAIAALLAEGMRPYVTVYDTLAGVFGRRH